MLYLGVLGLSLVLLLLLLLLRVYSVLPNPQRARKNASGTYRVMIFLGSGGHTTEMLSLVSGLDFTRYRPRGYFISDGDSLSAEKLRVMEAKQVGHTHKDSSARPAYDIIFIPRARRVLQPLSTTPFTALKSFLYCLRCTLRIADEPTLVLMNGPGTCVMLCAAIYAQKLICFWRRHTPELVYVESFARVTSLSLSGKLLRPFVDTFVVQWKELADRLQKGRWGGVVAYRGWLV